MRGSELTRLSAECLQLLDREGLTAATVESCTGGMLAAALTDHPGASRVLDRGFVVYSNEAKAEMLAVPQEILAAHGAVSGEVAAALVAGALARTPVDLVVAVTGIAGPAGATPDKPVGRVHIAAGRRGRPIRQERLQLQGDRHQIRVQAALRALDLLTQVAIRP